MTYFRQCRLAPALLRRPEFALEPFYRIGFEGIGAVAFKALKRAWSLAARRQREDQVGPASGASWSLCLAHALILPRANMAVNFFFNIHCAVNLEQIRANLL
jgi:hypothetical protein